MIRNILNIYDRGRILNLWVKDLKQYLNLNVLKIKRDQVELEMLVYNCDLGFKIGGLRVLGLVGNIGEKREKERKGVKRREEGKERDIQNSVWYIFFISINWENIFYIFDIQNY